MRQLLLELLPEAPPSLANFVPGGNADVLAAVTAWIAPGAGESSLLLWGEDGAGKTHLLRATTPHYHDAGASPDLAALACFALPPQTAGTDDDGTLAARQAQAATTVAVDNVEALSAAGQIALFNLFNRLRAGGGRLLTAAHLPPQRLQLREDLRTRLGSGLIFRLRALSDEEKLTALTAQAAARGLTLPVGALDYLMTHAPRDMRRLSAILAALDRLSLELKRPITLPLLREALQQPLPEPPSPVPPAQAGQTAPTDPTPCNHS